MFVNNNFKPYVSDICIIDDGVNCSDHLPIVCNLTFNINDNFDTPYSNINKAKPKYVYRWDKCDLISYYYLSGELLQSIRSPVELLHCHAPCKCIEHFAIIDNYYNSIVNALNNTAYNTVPGIAKGALKSF